MEIRENQNVGFADINKVEEYIDIYAKYVKALLQTKIDDDNKIESLIKVGKEQALENAERETEGAHKGCYNVGKILREFELICIQLSAQ